MQNLQGGHLVQLLFTGQEFFPALMDAIRSAQQEVRLETYIFHDDEIGRQVIDALASAAGRGVAVYLVVDGIGTPEIPDAWVERMQRSGVQWQQFLPLGSLGMLMPGRWRRLHRKLCVVDGTLAFCGGINILDDWLELNHGPQGTARFDFAVQVRGPLVAEVQTSMEQFWSRLLLTRRMGRGQFQRVRDVFSHHTLSFPKAVSARPSSGADIHAGLLLRDNVRNRNRIERAYRKAIAHARSEVVIANAYFMPGYKLSRALIHAVRRGVRVRLLLQGRYEFFMQFHAAKPFYDALLEAGVEIYEYHAGFMHAKVAVIDRKWATVGSSNLDPLSLLLAREANVVVEDGNFANELLLRLNIAIERDSTQLNKQRFENRPLGQRLKDRLAYALMRLTLFLSGKDY